MEMLSNLAHPLIPDLQVLDLPVSQDGRRRKHRLAPPEIGGQTAEILREMGFGDERIESLRQMGVVN
jgi:succinate--hydroxymethylglutarate CoA-transferase